MKDLKGLTQKEAEESLINYGKNELKEINKISIFHLFFRQLKTNLVLYFIAAAALISFIVGKSVTGFVLIAIVLIMTLTSFLQEYRAEKAIVSLKSMIISRSIVIRDGVEKEIDSSLIVPGDIIILRAGEKVSADAVIIHETELYVNESILTGESKDIAKKATRDPENFKQDNLIFMGTHIVKGKCVAKVIHTGMNTEFGKIAGEISTIEKGIPLQKKINSIAKYMIAISITVSILVGILLTLRADVLNVSSFIEILIVVLALTVSAFPEGLPVVMTITLARGAHQMATKNAIVRRMSVIETLGETTVICSDKTGTITKGEMTVKKIILNSTIIEVTGTGYEAEGKFLINNKEIEITKYPDLKSLLKCAAICNDAKLTKTDTDSIYTIRGSNTEGALSILSAKASIFAEDFKFERLEEIPFNSERKIMSVLCEGEGLNVYTKGAPEVVLEKCNFIQREGRIIRLHKEEKEELLKINKDLSNAAYRVLALAHKKANSRDKSKLENDLVFLGLVAMEDAPRDEVKAAIETCFNAGIKVKMITGDQQNTARAIANQIGLIGDILSGDELDKLTDKELESAVNHTVIFARVRPEHKLRIVRALKANGEIVTMTGDGINDAPALKEADIGVAMGRSGTDVSREVSDLVIKDDNFATIVEAVKEGRTVFNNIRKFVTYQLSCNFAELFILFIGILLGLPLPILALQILFMNLITDNLPAITLGFNPPSPDVLSAKPRKESKVLTRRHILLLSTIGTFMGGITLLVFYLSLHVFGFSLDSSRTIAMLTLIFLEIFNAFSFRSLRTPLAKLEIFKNRYLVYASAVSVIVTIIIIYTPINSVFGTTPIPYWIWLVSIAFGLSVIVAFDIIKVINNLRKTPLN